MWICIVHCHEHGSNVLRCCRFPYIGSDVPSPQPDTSLQDRLQDRGYVLVYYVTCLFAPQLLPCTHSKTTPPYAPRSSRFGSELPSVEDDVDIWRYAIVSCMPETTTTSTYDR